MNINWNSILATSSNPRRPSGRWTQSEVIEFYNRNTQPRGRRRRGGAKPLVEIWQESSEEALSNIFKPSQNDSGGSITHFYKLMCEIINVLKSTRSIVKAAEYLYNWNDQKRKKLRVTQIKRHALIVVKLRGGTINDYYSELTRMFNQTIDDRDKNEDRLEFANQDIMKEMMGIRNRTTP